MPDLRPLAHLEPNGVFRIPRACLAPWCGAVYYVASVTHDAACPACAASREGYSLSA
jgi:hypothetical protein